jgi:uncharacterized protein YjeT (DUF2065 family)
MTEVLVPAFALVLVLEGILPFVAPTLWRQAMRRISDMSDGQLRFMGLTSMMIGVIILYFVT